MNSTRGEALSIARSVASELMDAGAQSVILSGSLSRGDAYTHSDIDLYAIGAGPRYRLEQRGAHLVSISWRTHDEIHASFTNPADVGTVIPGWRGAVILSDPGGIAARLKQEAAAWTWTVIGEDRLNRWVAEELIGFAEEAHKLVAMLAQGRLQAAAIQRSVLALRIPVVMSVHLRLLYDTENVLWDRVAERLDAEWSRAQATALGLIERPFQESCHAALSLFALACGALDTLFDDRQRAIVMAAIRATESVTQDINSNSVVVILVEQEGRFLLIEEEDSRGNPAWYFPAGAVEAEESLPAAAEREVLEETGWTVEPTHLLRIDHGYFQRTPEVAWWRHVVVARPVGGVELTAPESSILNVEWLTPDELAGRNLRSADALDLIETLTGSGPGMPLSAYRFAAGGMLPGFYR